MHLIKVLLLSICSSYLITTVQIGAMLTTAAVLFATLVDVQTRSLINIKLIAKWTGTLKSAYFVAAIVRTTAIVDRTFVYIRFASVTAPSRWTFTPTVNRLVFDKVSLTTVRSTYPTFYHRVNICPRGSSYLSRIFARCNPAHCHCSNQGNIRKRCVLLQNRHVHMLCNIRC